MILLLRRSSSSSNRCLGQGKEVVGSVDTAAVVVVHLYGGDVGPDKGEGRLCFWVSLFHLLRQHQHQDQVMKISNKKSWWKSMFSSSVVNPVGSSVVLPIYGNVYPQG
ncbi:unnamed protein product [Camellia sinensis]